MNCPHCNSILLFSEDRGAHCDGCDDFDPSSLVSSTGSADNDMSFAMFVIGAMVVALVLSMAAMVGAEREETKQLELQERIEILKQNA